MTKAVERMNELLAKAHDLCRCYAADDWDDTNPTFEELLGELVVIAQAPVRADNTRLTAENERLQRALATAATSMTDRERAG